MPIVAGDEEGGVHIAERVLVLVQDDDHDHEEAEVGEELPVAEQDAQEGFDIAEEQVQVQVQEGVQSAGVSGYPVSVGHVPSVEPEPDAMQRYLEDSGP